MRIMLMALAILLVSCTTLPKTQVKSFMPDMPSGAATPKVHFVDVRAMTPNASETGGNVHLPLKMNTVETVTLTSTANHSEWRDSSYKWNDPPVSHEDMYQIDADGWMTFTQHPPSRYAIIVHTYDMWFDTETIAEFEYLDGACQISARDYWTPQGSHKYILRLNSKLQSADYQKLRWNKSKHWERLPMKINWSRPFTASILTSGMNLVVSVTQDGKDCMRYEFSDGDPILRGMSVIWNTEGTAKVRMEVKAHYEYWDRTMHYGRFTYQGGTQVIRGVNFNVNPPLNVFYKSLHESDPDKYPAYYSNMRDIHQEDFMKDVKTLGARVLRITGGVPDPREDTHYDTPFSAQFEVPTTHPPFWYDNDPVPMKLGWEPYHRAIQEMLDWAQKNDMFLILPLFDGLDRSASNRIGLPGFDFKQSDLEWITSKQARDYVKQSMIGMMTPFKDHPNVAGWEMWNEPVVYDYKFTTKDIYPKREFSTDMYIDYVRFLRETLDEIGVKQMFTDAQWGFQYAGMNNTAKEPDTTWVAYPREGSLTERVVNRQEFADEIDFVTNHLYEDDADAVIGGILWADSRIKSSKFNWPLLMTEIGFDPPAGTYEDNEYDLAAQHTYEFWTKILTKFPQQSLLIWGIWFPDNPERPEEWNDYGLWRINPRDELVSGNPEWNTAKYFEWLNSGIH